MICRKFLYKIVTFTTLEQINKGVFAIYLNILYLLVITTVGWYLVDTYNDLRYFYWTIFFTNILRNKLTLVFYEKQKLKSVFPLFEEIDFR